MPNTNQPVNTGLSTKSKAALCATLGICAFPLKAADAALSAVAGAFIHGEKDTFSKSESAGVAALGALPLAVPWAAMLMLIIAGSGRIIQNRQIDLTDSCNRFGMNISVGFATLLMNAGTNALAAYIGSKIIEDADAMTNDISDNVTASLVGTFVLTLVVLACQCGAGRNLTTSNGADGDALESQSLLSGLRR